MEKKEISVNIRIDPDLYKYLKDESEFEHLSVSQIIRNIIRHHYEQEAIQGDLKEAYREWLRSPEGRDELKEVVKEVLNL